jgi:hypothetical protein
LRNQLAQQRRRILALMGWDQLAALEMAHASDTSFQRSLRARQIITDDLRNAIARQTGLARDWAACVAPRFSARTLSVKRRRRSAKATSTS